MACSGGVQVNVVHTALASASMALRVPRCACILIANMRGQRVQGGTGEASRSQRGFLQLRMEHIGRLNAMAIDQSAAKHTNACSRRVNQSWAVASCQIQREEHSRKRAVKPDIKTARLKHILLAFMRVREPHHTSAVLCPKV